MSALEWRARMSAPKLAHSDGMVVVVLDGRTIVFPSEAAARFFFEAYTDIPNLAGQAAVAQAQIDEGALEKARAQVQRLEARVAKLEGEKAVLEAREVAEVKRRTEATRRATVLAKTLRRIREHL